jgi:hypothetical protein
VIDYDRTEATATGAYVVLRGGKRLVRIAMRDYGDHYEVNPGEKLSSLDGVRIRLVRRPKQTGD